MSYGMVLCLVTLTDLQMRRAGLSAITEFLVKLDLNDYVVYISFVWDRCLASVGCADPAHVELLALSVSLLPELHTSPYFLYWMNPCGERVVTYDCAACRQDQFKCVNSGRCISASLVCDGYNGCGDWSDERNCSEFVFQLIDCSCVFNSIVLKLVHRMLP